MFAKQSLLARRVAFERFEQRLVMTAQPWDDPAVAWERQLHEQAFDPPRPANLQWDSADEGGVRQRLGLTGDGQTVVVIDSGIAYEHPALGGGFGDGFQVVAGQDFTEEADGDPHDDGPAGFHGTHVAGIIASNDSQRPGIAPGVDLVALRVFNDQGVGSFEWLEAALQWVHAHHDSLANPITTVNLSVGGIWNSPDVPPWANLEDELRQLRDDGIVVVVAAGNAFAGNDPLGLSYPASSPLVIPVSSVAVDGSLSDFSQRDPRVLAAPGERIRSTIPDHIYGADGRFDDWAEITGTSMAAPHVTGAAVLVRQAMRMSGRTRIEPALIYDHLRATADTVWDTVTQAWYARLNIDAALDALLPSDSDSERDSDRVDAQVSRPLGPQTRFESQGPSVAGATALSSALLDFPVELLHTALRAPLAGNPSANLSTFPNLVTNHPAIALPVAALPVAALPVAVVRDRASHVVAAGDPLDVCRAPAPPLVTNGRDAQRLFQFDVGAPFAAFSATELELP